MAKFNMIDTKRPDGCYVTFERIEEHDADANPNDYLFQDDDYRDEDQARLDAWNNDDWSFIGLRAKATVMIVSNGVGVFLEFTSPGLWAVESDSGEDYLQEVYEEECEALKDYITAMAKPTYE